LFFSVDVHGADSVWRKWLEVPEIYGVDALLLCGDLTGKSLIPVIEQKNGGHKAYYFGKNWQLKTESETQEMEKRIQDAGAYTLRCNMDKVKELQDNPQQLETEMLEMIKQRMARWLDMLLDKVDINKVDVIIMPGNDEDFVVDEVIKSYLPKGVIWCPDDVVEVLGIQMVSLDYVNPTPWDTPREDNEKGLKKRITKLVKKLDDPQRSIFNFHAPP